MKKIPYLGLFVDALTGTGTYVPKTINNEALVLIEFVADTQIDQNDTLDLTLPDNVQKDMVPLAVMVWTQASPRVANATLAITSHNSTTGVTRFTGGSTAVAVGNTISVLYVPSTTYVAP